MDSKWANTPFKRFAYPFKWKTKIVKQQSNVPKWIAQPVKRKGKTV